MGDFKDGYVLVFDLETQNLTTEVPGRYRDEKIMNLEISCGCGVQLPLELCRDPNDRHLAFELRKEHTVWFDSTEPGKRIEDLLVLMDHAHLIVAYNQFGFDCCVLKKYYTSMDRFYLHLQKQLDVFAGVRGALTSERWPKLDWLLAQNRLEAKEASGVEAVSWFKTGTPEALAKLESYCLADTNLLCKLSLLHELNIGRGDRPLPNYCFGIASAIAARDRSLALMSEDEKQERESLRNSPTRNPSPLRPPFMTQTKTQIPS